MKHSNVNKTAMKIAWLLLKTNNIMTSKTKGFPYFLTIAYKMLRNERHFVYVLQGLVNIYYKMLRNPRVTSHRLFDYQTCLDKLVAASSAVVASQVSW